MDRNNFFWTLVGLIILYTIITAIDVKVVRKINKIDKLERELLKLKEVLNYKRITEDLNIRLGIVEGKMNKKGILSPQTVILIIIIILIIIYILRNRG